MGATSTVACEVCGGEVTSKNPAKYPYCRNCHYTGAAAEHENAALIDRFERALGRTGPGPDVSAMIEHTGGGCFWLAIRWPDDPVYYVLTDGEAQIPLDPETKRMLPTGGWGYVGRYHDDENHADYEGTEILTADGAVGGATHDRYWEEYPAHCLTEAQVIAAVQADREENQMNDNESATVRTSEILNLTIGRVTNETLEKVTAVSWKSEGENEGPIYLEVEGDGSGYQNLQPFNKGEAEWFASETAEQLAVELGVPVRYI